MYICKYDNNYENILIYKKKSSKIIYWPLKMFLALLSSF